MPRPSHLHGYSTHFDLTTFIRPVWGRSSHSSHFRQGCFAGEYYRGRGREKQGRNSCQFLSVSSVLFAPEGPFRVVRVPRLREGKISRFRGPISSLVFLRTTTCWNLVFLRRFPKAYNISCGNRRNYVSRRDAGALGTNGGSCPLISAPPRLCARRFWLRPSAARPRCGFRALRG